MNIGIVGLGVISKFYVSAIRGNPELRLGAVCDGNRAALEEFAGQGCPVFTDFRDLMRADVDAVIVNVPNDLHFEVCKAALLAGKHVCCEKPLALNVQDAAWLTEFAETAGLTMMTAFHRRYNDNVIRAKRALDAAPPPQAVRIDYSERIEDHCGRDAWYLDPAKCGGGCVADNGPNVFDTLIELFGPLTLQTAETTRNRNDIDVEAKIAMTAGAGIPIEVRLDWQYPDGEKKTIDIEWSDAPSLSVDMLAGFPQFKSSLLHEYVGVVEDFRRRVEAGISRGDRGLDVARLVDAVYAAANAEGGRRV